MSLASESKLEQLIISLKDYIEQISGDKESEYSVDESKIYLFLKNYLGIVIIIIYSFIIDYNHINIIRRIYS